jgi:hypothetical protein
MPDSTSRRDDRRARTSAGAISMSGAGEHVGEDSGHVPVDRLRSAASAAGARATPLRRCVLGGHAQRLGSMSRPVACGTPAAAPRAPARRIRCRRRAPARDARRRHPEVRRGTTPWWDAGRCRRPSASSRCRGARNGRAAASAPRRSRRRGRRPARPPGRRSERGLDLARRDALGHQRGDRSPGPASTSSAPRSMSRSSAPGRAPRYRPGTARFSLPSFRAYPRKGYAHPGSLSETLCAVEKSCVDES